MKKRVIWVGMKGDNDTPYEYEGMKFSPRTVQPVSDAVYEAVKNIRGFHSVLGVNTKVFDYQTGSVL